MALALNKIIISGLTTNGAGAYFQVSNVTAVTSSVSNKIGRAHV